MLAIPGYEIAEAIYTGVSTVVYRGRRERDFQPVVLKLLNKEYPTPEELAKFKQQYEITKNLDLPGAVKSYSLETYQNSLVVVMEDFGGQSLKDYISAHRLNLLEFLQIARLLAETLGQLHHKNIIHKDIKPQNIIINPQSGHVKIADFSLATLLSRESHAASTPNLLEGTLAYMSPEQTGRMNRSIDRRTDFYSLGVTFYEMLAGELPFSTSDPVELVHSHIAKMPVPPREAGGLGSKGVGEIPKPVSDIVMKLLAKTAEDRYQSAWGLKADLETCLHQLQKTGKIADFSLGSQDFSGQLQIPQKLYGREKEVAALMASFERVAAGTAEMALVAGYSGIGKSALVSEIHKPIVRERGYFIAGKFDQFRRNIPYSALIQAFQDLMRQLLTESEAQIEAWKEKLADALGQNGQVIVDVIPEVKLIAGKQPPVPKLGPAESQNRFHLVFQKFMRVFAKKEHPLAIFLDDLQWADLPSLKLIQLLVGPADSAGTAGNLLLIGAYRDSEVDGAHPLMLAIEEIAKAGARINRISLRPLNRGDLRQFIAGTLNCKPEKSQPLAELLLLKTSGNPFFLTQLLKSLHSENLLSFNFSTAEWEWDIERIQGMGLTDNVVELMAGTIEKLSEETQNALKLAACIGSRFNLDVLATVSEKSLASTAADLWEALEAGLILPMSNAYKLPALLEELEEFVGMPSVASGIASGVEYKFLHDRVQQAAYALIPELQKRETHLKIGRLLLQNTPADRVEENIFELVNQLNLGIGRASSQSEKLKLAQLNLIAGRKAKASAACEPSLKYFTAGIELLPPEAWETQYELTLGLFESAAEAAYLNTDFEEMEKWAEKVLEHSKTQLDKVRVYEVKIQACLARNQMQSAVQMVLQAISILGVSVPEKPSKSEIQQALSETAAKLNGKVILDLIDLPVMSDPAVLAVMRLLASANAPAYTATPKLLPVIVSKQVNLSVECGNADASPLTYAYYGAMLCGAVDSIESGYKFGQVALNLLERFDDKQIQARTMDIVYGMIQSWKVHLRETLEPLKDAYQIGRDNGTFEYAGYSILKHCYYSFLAGVPLQELDQKLALYTQDLKELKQGHAVNYLQRDRQAVLNFMEESPHPGILTGKIYDEPVELPRYHRASDRYGLLYFYLNKLILSYLFQEFDSAAENGNMAKKYLDGGTGLALVGAFYFYDSLARLAVAASFSKAERRRPLIKVKSNQEKMREWAQHAPVNFQHKYELVEAERARVLGRTLEAMEYYDRAIAGAKKQGYIQEEALACELAGAFYLSLGREKVAKTYLTEAHYCYTRWGAKAKVAHLESKYPQFLGRKLALNKTELGVTISTTTSTTSSSSGVLDLTAVVRSSQALAGEIVLDKLLATLMKIVIENAGAEKGFLILEKEGRWVIEASGSVDCDSVTVLQSVPADSIDAATQTPVLSAAIINYVARTHSHEVLNDAAREGQYTRDPYIVATQTKSILCTPLIHQGKLCGILYLENNLTAGAFTPDRLEVLQLLSSQIAISIENAQLYANLREFNQNLEQLVEERTQELSQTLENLKATQKKLVDSEKMASLGGLVAGVAHEINTPIGIGVTAASLLAEKATAFFETYKAGQMKRSDLEKFLDTAMQSSSMVLANLNRAAELIQSFKQVAVDQSSESKRTFNIRDYLQEILLSLRAKLKATKHRVEIHGDRNLTLDTYPGALSQIVTNLVMNSLIHAYDPEDCGLIRFEFKQDGDRVIFEYTDDGKGIPPENLSRIFDPFFTTKRGQGGTGLGLHLLYNLVTQKLQGTIECESQVGAGTKFLMTLPAQM
ncbi:trifunctional serine/threonine-protein kinase/ATP-binding protein/sensor histidine kinase [Kamptonema formosum]|uniref:trifunctional serine/threonine-protein kinase/ATP-binding protein/sensor histidine kinase n=1 Tax=Kamptonema formosum TaxID=331992 RepID=UPI00034B70A4|nr:ATP-binding sensor histidine kinase [Oscillatoria sp. PCC 10802]